MTAGHVLDTLAERTENGDPLVISSHDNRWAVLPIEEYERLDADIGVIRCPHSTRMMPNLRWSFSGLPIFAPVRAIGYAYGTHMVDQERMIVARGFSGKVVCALPRFKPLAYVGRSFSVYELSFQAPRGLSGSPLTNEEVPAIINGLVIGNSYSEMLVSFETETDNENNSVRSVERVERMTLGIAVPAHEIASLQSKLLGTTIGDHLKSQGLITDF